MFLLDVLSQTFLQGTGSTTTPAKCSRGNSHSQDWNNCFTCFRNHILMKNINLKHDDWIQTMPLLEYEMVHSKITTPRYSIMFWMSLAAAKSPVPRTMYHISSKLHTCCVYLITTHTVSYFDRRGGKKKTLALTHSFGVVEVTSHNFTRASVSVANTAAVFFGRRADDAVTANFLSS